MVLHNALKDNTGLHRTCSQPEMLLKISSDDGSRMFVLNSLPNKQGSIVNVEYWQIVISILTLILILIENNGFWVPTFKRDLLVDF